MSTYQDGRRTIYAWGTHPNGVAWEIHENLKPDTSACAPGFIVVSRKNGEGETFHRVAVRSTVESAQRYVNDLAES